jgi:recombination protein RecT
MSNQNQLAMVKKDTVDIVAAKVKQFQENGELHFPANYSPENAMKSAWLILQTIKDRNQKPALEVCTRDSVANALLDMVVQGLNPAKKQCYFIVYGNQLVCQRSYFGTMAVTKRVTGAKDIMQLLSMKVMMSITKWLTVVSPISPINRNSETSTKIRFLEHTQQSC